MQKQRRKYDRVQSCSTQSFCRSDVALESRDTFTETAVPETPETAAQSSNKNPLLDASDNMPSSSGRISLVDKVTEKTNIRRIMGKRKNINRNRKQTFRNTVVLAPFHALKQSFQNKLKDIYIKGTLDNKAKKLKIPNNSMFQYEVMEMRMGQSYVKVHEREVNSRKKSASAEIGSNAKKGTCDTFDENEYCLCFRNGKRPVKETLFGSAEGTSTDLPADITNNTEAVSARQAPKRMRINNDKDVEPTNTTSHDERTVAHKDSQQNILKTNTLRRKQGSNKEEGTDNRRNYRNEGKSLIRNNGKGNSERTTEFKYQTRSVTRKENAHFVDCLDLDDVCLSSRKARQNYANCYPDRNSILATEDKMESDSLVPELSPQKTLTNQLEETAAKSTNLSAMKSDISILFLEEIKTTKEKTTQDVARIMENTGRLVEKQNSNFVEKGTCASDNQKKPVETQTSVSEVNHVFRTLSRKQTFESNHEKIYCITEDNGSHLGKEKSKPEVNRSTSPAFKSRDDGMVLKKSERISNSWVEEQANHRNGDEQIELEPIIMVEEMPNESSSSDRISDISRKMDNSGTSAFRGNFPKMIEAEGLDQTSSYIFGQKNLCQQVRGSCEFEFCRLHSVSSDVDECESAGNLEFEKN